MQKKIVLCSQSKSNEQKSIGFWVNAIFISLACLQSQTFLLPVFLWSFLLLLPSWIAANRKYYLIPIHRRINLYLIILVMVVPLIVLCLNAVRPESAIFLVTSISCGVMAFISCMRRPYVASAAAVIYIVFHLGAASLTLVCAAFDVYLNTLIFSEGGDSLRFRGLAMEPNHLGFSMCVAYLIIIYDPCQYFLKNKKFRFFLLISALLITLWTNSPFAILMIFMISTPYLWDSKTGRLVFILIIIIGFIVAMESERIERIINGEDSSANFRTWGSLIIGYLQIEKCGLIGCGLGNGRNVLEVEPLMTAFAAQETLVLPNLFAGAMVDGGYLLLAFVISALWFACFPPHLKGRFRPIAWSFFALMVAYSASGSYPYDPHYWSALGMLAAVNRLVVNHYPFKEKVFV